MTVHFSKRMIGRLPLIQPAYVQLRVKPDPHAKLLGVVIALALAFLLGTLAGCTGLTVNVGACPSPTVTASAGLVL